MTEVGPPVGVPSMRLISSRAISTAISSTGWRTVVSGGRQAERRVAVVEADHGDIVRYPPAVLVQHGQRALRHQVVGGEHPVDVRMPRPAAGSSPRDRPRR